MSDKMMYRVGLRWSNRMTPTKVTVTKETANFVFYMVDGMIMKEKKASEKARFFEKFSDLKIFMKAETDRNMTIARGAFEVCIEQFDKATNLTESDVKIKSKRF